MKNHKVGLMWGSMTFLSYHVPCNNRGTTSIQNGGTLTTHTKHHALAPKTMSISRPMLHDVAAKIVASKKRKGNSRDIPHDVMLEILSRVPARSLVRFRCVRKLWNSLFRDSHFISLQLNHATKNPTTFFGYKSPGLSEHVSFYSFEIAAGKVVLGSDFAVPADDEFCHLSNTCNGLIAYHGLYTAYVANPCTREWMALPEATPHGQDLCLLTRALWPFLGLGFSMATGKYKLVRLFSRDGRTWACEVLTLGTDRSWRSLGEVPYRVSEFEPAYSNGHIYWTIDEDFYAGPERIFSFDVCREEFTTVQLPPQCQPEPYGAAAYHHFSMCVLEGSLCLVDWRVYKDVQKPYYLPVMHLHVLKKHEPDPIWMESHSIRFKRIRVHPKDGMNRGAGANSMFPIAIRNGKLLINRPYKTWKLHDLRTGTCTKMELPNYRQELPYIWNRGVPFACAESIVPIDSLKN